MANKKFAVSYYQFLEEVFRHVVLEKLEKCQQISRNLKILQVILKKNAKISVIIKLKARSLPLETMQ